VIDPGVVGSPADVGTLIVCVVGFRRLSESQDTGHAATVALARCVPRVDADRVMADLDVHARAVRQYISGGEDGTACSDG